MKQLRQQFILNSLGLLMEPYRDSRPVVALDIAGAIPYYSAWEALDYYGLCDATLPKMRGKGVRVPAEYLTHERVDMLILHDSSLDSSRYNFAVADELFRGRTWDYLGSCSAGSSTLSLYFNDSNKHLSQLRCEIKELLKAASSRPIGIHWSIGVSLQPEGRRFSDIFYNKASSSQ